jgi:ABC-2 type transport system permease protein
MSSATPATPASGASPAKAARAVTASRLDSAWTATARIGLLRGGLEIRSFFRQRDTVVFTFALPVILLALFGQIFHGTIGATGVPFRQYFAAGIVASGVASTSFVNLGSGVAADRADGTLKRLAGTPAPAAAYFVGKAISALVVSVLEVAVLLAVGAALLGLHLPDSPGRWLTFAWVFTLGVGACSMLGIAASGLARSPRGASAVINMPYLVLSFISGVYFVFDSLPRGLQQVAALFPLKWMCQGLREVFLPASFAAAEPAHHWEPGRVALVLAAWMAASLVLCLKSFRWRDRD